MADPFIAEIKMFAGNFAPRGYAFCNGQLLPIAQNTALFSLVGTTYGGDGRTTFGVPNLQGRAAMHEGNGPGLTPRSQGQVGGADTETLTDAQMPAHTHTVTTSLQPGNEDDIQNDAYLGGGGAATTMLYSPAGTAYGGTMAAQAIPSKGGNQSHDNQQPYLVLNFIIALTGSYPSRS